MTLGKPIMRVGPLISLPSPMFFGLTKSGCAGYLPGSSSLTSRRSGYLPFLGASTGGNHLRLRATPLIEVVH